MNCAIIGFGSIGKRHHRILKKSKIFSNIFVISKRYKKKNFFQKLSDIKEKKINYFVISNETHKHLDYFNYIENNYTNSKILIEKPIFHKSVLLKKKLNNNYYVGYNLRFSPVVNYIKNFFSKHDVFFLEMNCKTFLPNWRNGRHYSQIYSSFKSKGGGVVNDLSHELDLLNYMFGKYKIISSYTNKISNLKISSEDICICFGKFISKIFFSVHLNFFTKIESRKFIIVSKSNCAEVDLKKNTVLISYKNKSKKIKFKNNRNTELLKMHKNILFKKGKDACSLRDGNYIAKIIEDIKKK